MSPSPATSLATGIARRRILYPAPIVTAPSMLVIDIPKESRGGGLALDRYYPIILERPHEEQELEAYLQASRDTAALPDLFDRRASALRSDAILIIRYEPPAIGWPWLSLAWWPTEIRALAVAAPIDMARGCYTMEAFTTPRALEAHQASMLTLLRARHDVEVGVIAGATLGHIGSS